MNRRAPEATQNSRQAVSQRDDAEYVRSLIESGASMASVVVAGGLRRMTPAQMFPEHAVTAHGMDYTCTCGLATSSIRVAGEHAYLYQAVPA